MWRALNQATPQPDLHGLEPLDRPGKGKDWGKDWQT